MNADICVPHAPVGLHIRIRRGADGELRVSRVDGGRRGTHERVRNRVSSWIAPFQMSPPVVRMGRRHFVLMRRESVVMLGVIVIAVGVRVERRRQGERRKERRDEQQRQDAVHSPSL